MPNAPRPAPAVTPIPDVRLRVLEVAGGDPAFADALRAHMWRAYDEAGRPAGDDEDAMYRWWASGAATTVQ